MKKNKLSAFILILSLGVSSVLSPLYAESLDKRLQGLIVKAKTTFEISDEYKEFDYNSYFDEEHNLEIYNFDWKCEENDKTINLSMDSNGNIYSYYLYSNDMYNKNKIFNVLSDAELEKNANEALKKLLPNYYSQMKLVKKNISNYDNFVEFEFKRYLDDIPVLFNNATIYLNKYTGELTEYFCPSPEKFELSLPSTENIVSLEKAKESFKASFPLTLSYFVGENSKVFPAYTLDDISYCAIDAHTGKKVKVINDYITGKQCMNFDKGLEYAEAADGSAYISEAEQTAIDYTSEFISKEAAFEAVKKLVPSIPASLELKRATLFKNYSGKDDKNSFFTWTLFFENGSAEINAKTKELLSFYYLNENEENIDFEKISEVEAIDPKKEKEFMLLAEDFLKKASPTKASNYKNIYKSYMLDENKNLYSTVLTYSRNINGIPFNQDSCMFIIKNDNIISFDLTYTEGLEFPSISNVISPEKALQNLYGYYDFGLNYILDVDDKPVLAYSYINTPQFDSTIYIDAYKGKQLNYDGSEFKENSGDFSSYSDLKGHWVEETVNKLAKEGYYLKADDKKFRPDDEVKQIDFFRYFYPAYIDDNDEDFYEYLKNFDELKGIDLDPEASVSRIDAANIIIHMHYSPKLAGLDIYNSDFTDNEAISEKYIGFAVICDALGIIKADSDGRFNPDKALTRAETASILYNTLLIINND